MSAVCRASMAFLSRRVFVTSTRAFAAGAGAGARCGSYRSHLGAIQLERLFGHGACACVCVQVQTDLGSAKCDADLQWPLERLPERVAIERLACDNVQHATYSTPVDRQPPFRTAPRASAGGRHRPWPARVGMGVGIVVEVGVSREPSVVPSLIRILSGRAARRTRADILRIGR